MRAALQHGLRVARGAEPGVGESDSAVTRSYRERSMVATNGLTILVIDDDEDYCASVQSLLESRGCRVAVACSGQRGLEEIARQRPDLIVLDIMMESTTEGYVVNQALKFCSQFSEYQDIPVVMVSSIEASPDELFPRAGEVGMIRPDWYLTKPLDIPRLLEVIDKVAARKACRT
jgi:CheY-like chemotaxis protein